MNFFLKHSLFTLACSNVDGLMGKSDIFYFKNRLISQNSIAGFNLLAGLIKKSNIVLKDPLEIVESEYKKPYFANSNLKFNISHSSNFVAACISKYEVGVDIENMVMRNFSHYGEKLFSKNEAEGFFKSADGCKYFYDIWCAKESFLKCKGLGIRQRLSSIDVSDGKAIVQYGKVLCDYSLFNIEMGENINCKVVLKTE